MTRGSLVRACREAFLTVGAVLGLVGILLVLAGALFGVRPLLFRSGSMAPAIHTGDLAIARSVPVADLAPGDIVSVVNAGGQRVTHRLVSAGGQGDVERLTLKGDANRSPDAEVYTVARADKVLFHLPKVGYVVAAATSQAGVFVLGGYVALLLFLIFGGRKDDSAPPGPSPGRRGVRGRGGRRRTGVSMARTVSVVTVTGLVALAGPASAAPWTDVVPVSATMTASVVSPPVVTCGALKVGSVVLSWTAVPGATGYTLHYGSGGGTTEEVGSNVTSKSLSGLLGSGVFTVQTKITHGANTWTSVASNAKNYSILLFLVSTCTDA